MESFITEHIAAENPDFLHITKRVRYGVYFICRELRYFYYCVGDVRRLFALNDVHNTDNTFSAERVYRCIGEAFGNKTDALCFDTALNDDSKSLSDKQHLFDEKRLFYMLNKYGFITQN